LTPPLLAEPFGCARDLLKLFLNVRRKFFQEKNGKARMFADQVKLISPFVDPWRLICKSESRPMSSVKRSTQPEDAKQHVVTHTHYCVPQDFRLEVLKSWQREDFEDVYWDLADMRFTTGNLWLRVRDGTDFAFKIVHSDVNHTLAYFEASGTLDEEPGVRDAMERPVLLASVARYRNTLIPHVWIDFTTFSDGEGAGQTLHDCVATVHGDLTEGEIPKLLQQLGGKHRRGGGGGGGGR
jgi:hypothetical protein